MYLSKTDLIRSVDLVVLRNLLEVPGLRGRLPLDHILPHYGRSLLAITALFGIAVLPLCQSARGCSSSGMGLWVYEECE